MKLEFGNTWTVWLLGCCAVFTVVLTTQWLLPASAGMTHESGANTGDAGLPAARATDYAPPSIDAHAAVLEQPLFFKDRKLPVKPVAEQAAAPQTPLRLKLEGVVLVADSKVAVLRSLADNKLLQLAPGMVHSGWNLEDVTADSATFKRGEQRSTLSLELAGAQRR